jgi:hypothetical protein
MTPRKPANPDAITLAEAAAALGISEIRVTRLRREGLLVRLGGYPSYSHDDIQAFIDNPWLNGRQAALLLGVSHNRVSQLASADQIPVHFTASGRRVYRQRQIEVVANARGAKGPEGVILPDGSQQGGMLTRRRAAPSKPR